MKQDLIAILDVGSEENSRLARAIRALGVYSEIYPHDIKKEELLAQKGLSEAEIETVYLIFYPLAYRYLKTEQYEKGQAVAEKAVLAGKRMVQKSEFRCKQTSWALAVAADCYGYAGQVERAKALAEEAKTYKLRYKKFMDFHPEKDPYGKGDSKYYNNVLGNMDSDPETYTVIL